MADYLLFPNADFTTDPDDATNVICVLGVTNPATITGLTNGTGYVAQPIVRGPASAVFTPTAAPDVTAPVLSSPTAAADGATGATTLGVTTDEGNGTLYWGIYPTASTPSAADVVAGTGATVSGSQAVSGTGAQSVADQTGLTASTAYDVYYVHDDAATNRSNVATAAEFTTSAAPTADTIRFPGGVSPPYIEGLGITGSTFNIEAEVILQDVTTAFQGIFAANAGGTDYFGLAFDAASDRIVLVGEAGGIGFQQNSYSGFGWVVGTAVTVRMSCAANVATWTVTDGSNTATITDTFTDVTTLVSVMKVMTDADNTTAFAADMDSITVNQTGATGGDTFTGTVAEWNAGSGSAPQFTMNGTVAAAP